MKRLQYAPGISYGSKSTLSVISQPVVGRGAQSLGHIKEEASTLKKSSTMSTLSAGEIANRVSAAVKEGRIKANEADSWTDRLAENPGYADLLEQLAAVPGLNDQPTSLSAVSVPSYSNLSAGDYRQHLPANAPKLFDNGDLPVMTASGIDVDLLRQVPWQARPAVARAKTYAEAHELVTKYSGELGQVQADFDAVSGGDLFGDVMDYEDRLEAWGTFDATDAEARQLTGGPSELIKKQWAQFAKVVKSRKNQGNPGDHFPYDTDPLNVFSKRNGNYKRFGGK
ncbi:MAG: hypothetical protein M3456_00510 [Actinomycetota bacterium]|nr:hypothetical protein [Actinomycetota bacterium]